ELQVELLVDRDVVLAAVRFVMIDVPPDIEHLDEVALLVEELDGPLEPAEQLHALRMIADQGVYESGGLVDEVAGAGNPVIFQVTRAAFEADHDDCTAMLVGADDACALDPQDVAEPVAADVEGEVAQRGVRAKRDPWTFLLGWAYESAL